jgi:hypothetical protein
MDIAGHTCHRLNAPMKTFIARVEYLIRYHRVQNVAISAIQVFALFAQKSQYGILDAFEVFLSANLLRWQANSDFASAAKDALDQLEEMKV